MLAGDSILPELLAICGFLLLPWVGITVALNSIYDTHKAAAVQSTANLTQALEESTRRTIGSFDSFLLSVRGMQLAQGEQFDLPRWVAMQTLSDLKIAQVSITDRTGLVIASTVRLAPGISVADRPHFRAQIDPAHDDLFISQPVIGRASGLETIQFTRKLLDPGGGFAGIVVLSLETAELARFYEALGLGKGFVALLAADGAILASGPRIAAPIGADARRIAASGTLLAGSTGSTELLSVPGRGALIASFRHLREYPLIMVVGLDTATVLAPYRSLRNGALLIGVAITLAVGLIGVFWVRQKRRSLASGRALQVTLENVSQGILMLDKRGNVLVTNTRVFDLLGNPDQGPDTPLEFLALRAHALAASHVAPSNNDDASVGVGTDGGEARPAHSDQPLDRCHANDTLPWREGKFEASINNGIVIEVRTRALPEGGCVQTYADVTQQRQEHAQVVHLAHHDALTGLANRVALMGQLFAITSRHLQRDEPSALIVIDLDGFKGINDTLGHDAGDVMLIEVGARLKMLVRGVDIVARLGGDEFVVLLPSVPQREDISLLAHRIIQRVAEPMQIAGQQVRIGASLGIAFHPVDGMDAETWLKHADMALYSAKSGGRGIYRCFDQQLSFAVTEHRQLASELRQALDSEELEVYFQPKFDCRSLQITGFEALARWPHPARGFVSPTVFVRIAEDCGLVNRLGEFILQQTCRRIAGWEAVYPVAVNVSVIQLRDTGLNELISGILKHTGLLPQHLEIEVTESVMAEDGQVILENLQAIKAMGIAIALDDFGTGYSSLSHLQRFVFDKIKIDRSFVQGQADDPSVRVILKAILGMCHDLGLATVGEGIETEEQLAVLRDLGCTDVQGYLLGRPMAHDEVQDFISNHRRSLCGRAAIDTNYDTVAFGRGSDRTYSGYAGVH